MDKLKLKIIESIVLFIKEINTFNEDALICAKYLNLEISQAYYEITQIFQNGNRYKSGTMSIDFTSDDEFELWRSDIPKEEKDGGRYLFFNPMEWNITNIGKKTKHAVPKNKQKIKYELEFTKVSKNKLVF
jgi:hypothetical protein